MVITDNKLSISPNEGKILFNLVRDLRPKVVLEIGTGHGISTEYMLNGLPHNGMIYTFDIENREKIYFPTKRIQFFNGKFEKLVLPIDFAFLDSDHQINNIVSDIEKIEPCLTKNGVIVVHDVVYIPTMGQCLRDYFSGIESDLMKTIPLKPSDKKWIYKEKQTEFGLGIAIRGKR